MHIHPNNGLVLDATIHRPNKCLQHFTTPFVIINHYVNTMRPKQNGRHFSGGIFKCIFVNEIIWISNAIRLKFLPKGLIDNNTELVQIMASRRTGDKPLSEPMVGDAYMRLSASMSFNWRQKESWITIPILRESTLTQVMAWCCQATSYYVNQFWCASYVLQHWCRQ